MIGSPVRMIGSPAWMIGSPARTIACTATASAHGANHGMSEAWWQEGPDHVFGGANHGMSGANHGMSTAVIQLAATSVPANRART